MRWEIVRRTDELAGLYPAWESLWKSSSARPVTLHPAWIDGWWRSLSSSASSSVASSSGSGFEGELLTVLIRDGDDLVGVLPAYLAAPHGGALRARELRVLGDGIVGLSQAVLSPPGMEARARDLVVEALCSETGWDLLDVTFSLPDDPAATGNPPGSMAGARVDGEAELLARRFGDLGRSVERDPARGRPDLLLSPSWERFLDFKRLPPGILEGPAGAVIDVPSASLVGDRLPSLETMLNRRGVAVVPANGAIFRVLERALGPLVTDGAASLRLLSISERGTIAASVVLVDGQRHVELLRAGDAVAGEHLALLAVRHACDSGAQHFEFASELTTAAGPASLSSLLSPIPARGERLRVYRRSAAAVMKRGYASLRRHASQITRAPIKTLDKSIDRLRGAAPEVLTRTVARVATFSQLHLYRGELFVRNGDPPPGTTIALFRHEEFLALDDTTRFLERLRLTEAESRLNWERGDLAVLALCDGQPAGILWCARGKVLVPDLGREVSPGSGECYIHDVYVTPEARGRAVAPAMLEFLARELRSRDIYRAWALIERANTASTRAFEKVGYASVADVIYARMGRASKLLVRPPDRAARSFLGLPNPS